MQQDIRWGEFMPNDRKEGAMSVMAQLIEAVRNRTEYVISFYKDGTFAYYSSNQKEIVRLSKLFGWLLCENRLDTSGIITGRGYYPTECFDACFRQCSSSECSGKIENILFNTWAPFSYDGQYFPEIVPFRHFTKKGYNCYYLYDYYRKDTKHQRTDHEKRARNLIFRMLCGVQHKKRYVLL